MRFVYGLMLAVAVSCGVRAAPDLLFPERATPFPYYLNQSGITGADLLARHELERARKLTGIDFNMVLLADLPANCSVEEYANKLFARWGIGRATGGKGVLILLVEKRHALKIEVSYELEPLFTDAFCESFQDQIKLYFASRQFGDVVENLITTMAEYAQRAATGGSTDGMKLDLPVRIDLAQAAKVESAFLSGGGGVVKSDYFYDRERKLAQVMMIDPALAGEFRASKDPDETVRRYLRSLELGLNYPFLDVFVEGSQYMRIEYAKSPRYLRQLHDNYRQAMPYRIKQQGDLGVVRFKKGSPVFPLFLRRDENGYWRLDIAKAWAFMAQTYDLKSVTMVNTDHPWMFAFPDYSYEPSKMPPAPALGFPLNLKQRIAILEQAIRDRPEVAANYFELADIFYWECYWIAGAIEVAEKGLALDPARTAYRWLVIDMRSHYPLLDGIPAQYEAILKRDPNDLKALYDYSYFCREYLKDAKRAASLRAHYEKIRDGD